MSYIGATLSERLGYTRHSYEGAVGRKHITKEDLDIYHRSIQSDPGVSFDILRHNIDAVLAGQSRNFDLRSAVLKRYDAGMFDFNSGRIGLIRPMFKGPTTEQFLENYRRDCNVNLRHSNHGKVISTSLSSSATSLYSDDDAIREPLSLSPVSPYGSDCSSILDNSCYYGQGEVTERDSDADNISLNEIQQNIHNNNIGQDTLTKLNGTCMFNLNNNCQEDKSNLYSTSDSKQCSSDTADVSCVQKNITDNTVTSRENLAKDKIDDIEHFSISDHWFLQEDGQNWSRIESKELEGECSTLEVPVKFEMGTSQEFEKSEDETICNEYTNVNAVDAISREDKDSLDQKKIATDTDVKHLHKSKSSFFRRIGEDLKKYSSMKKHEYVFRNNSDLSRIHDPTVNEVKGIFFKKKNVYKNHKINIGNPILQTGHEKLKKMKCVPIESSRISSSETFRKNSSISVDTSSSSGSSTPVHIPTSTFDVSRILPNSTSGTSSIRGQKFSTRKDNVSPDRENSVFHVPPSHKPGTFPTALHQQSELETAFSTPSSESSSRSHSTSDNAQANLEEFRSKSFRPKSVYDNLDESHLMSFTDEVFKCMGIRSRGTLDDSGVSSTDSSENPLPGVDIAFWSVDDMVEQTHSLQQLLNCWDSSDDMEKAESVEDNPLSSEGVRSLSSENISISEDEIEKENLYKNRLQSKLDTVKRVTAGYDTKNAGKFQMHCLSAGQFMLLRRLAVLKLTCHLEKFNRKSSNSWSVPRFIRKLKEPDYKDKSVFAVPLMNNVQRLGQPIPSCILNAFDYLRQNSLDQVGIFRKPGVRLRIQSLKAKCEENPNLNDFSDFSAFDVADLVKLYFRELPDPLMTINLSETFVGIFLYVSENLRLEILQSALILLPDENREALKTLLHFLKDVTSSNDQNQMNASNLSTCFAPSLFHLQINSTKITASSSPKLKKSQNGKHTTSSFKSSLKEMNDNNAATQCLIFMIENIDELFQVHEDTTTKFRMAVMHQPEDVLAAEIGHKFENQDIDDYRQEFHSYVDRMEAATLREEQKISQNKAGSWQSSSSAPAGSEVMSKKINDGNHLRVWRSRVDIKDVTPEQIINRIIYERELWDSKIQCYNILDQPDERTHLCQMVVKDMPSQLTREYCLLRTWRKNITPKGGAFIAEMSTYHPTLIGDVRAIVLTSRYVIEPDEAGKSCSLTHVCRVDTKGRNPEWYNKAYGHIIARQLLKIKDSFRLKFSKSVLS